MNKPTKQTSADYKQIMNSKSVQEMKELINSQKINFSVPNTEVTVDEFVKAWNEVRKLL